jgi:tetratricopeptide (TPR) repeat protein
MAMHRASLFFLTAIHLLVAGCAGFGVVETSDPAKKLSDANVLLYRQDRALIAERLIRQAIDIYVEKGDDLGLAEAYRAYGFFFRSDSVEGRWNKFYRERGFLETSAKFDDRHAKSIEYFEKAGELFRKHDRFDALTNIHFNSAITYVMMGELKAACQAFDASLQDNRENIRRNPVAKPVTPAGFGSYEEFLAATKKRYGCAYA